MIRAWEKLQEDRKRSGSQLSDASRTKRSGSVESGEKPYIEKKLVVPLYNPQVVSL